MTPIKRIATAVERIADVLELKHSEPQPAADLIGDPELADAINAWATRVENGAA